MCASFYTVFKKACRIKTPGQHFVALATRLGGVLLYHINKIVASDSQNSSFVLWDAPYYVPTNTTPKEPTKLYRLLEQQYNQLLLSSSCSLIADKHIDLIPINIRKEK